MWLSLANYTTHEALESPTPATIAEGTQYYCEHETAQTHDTSLHQGPQYTPQYQIQHQSMIMLRLLPDASERLGHPTGRQYQPASRRG
jgi:hypothetical protein